MVHIVQELETPVVRDQDVPRLRVPVHHQPIVGVLDRLAHGEEEVEAAPQGEVAGLAEAVKRLTLHQLHGEPGLVVGGDAAVHQAGDAGVFQEGQDATLLQEAAVRVPPTPGPPGTHTSLPTGEGLPGEGECLQEGLGKLRRLKTEGMVNSGAFASPMMTRLPGSAAVAKITTPTAPFASARWTFWTKEQPPRSRSATFPWRSAG